MITSEQIRAARSMLRISVAELAAATGVGVATIKRIEAGSGVPSAHARTLDQIRRVLVSYGIDFIGSAEDAPGVRLHAKK